MIGDFNILFWVHMLALSAIGTELFAVAVVASQLDAAKDPQVKKVIARLGIVGGIGLVVLIASGLLMFWLRGYSFAGLGFWFAAKMSFLVLALICGAWQSRLAGRVAGGDAGASIAKARVDWVMRGLFVLIVAAAVMTFH